MKYFDQKSISEAKRDFPSIVREAGQGYETIAANNKSIPSPKVSIISTDLFEEILKEGYPFHPTVEEDKEGLGYTVSLEELLIHGEGSTLSEALQDLAENLVDYAGDYLRRMDFFRQIENRKRHYPYLRRIAACNDIKQVMEVIAECHTGLRQVISKQSPED